MIVSFTFVWCLCGWTGCCLCPHMCLMRARFKSSTGNEIMNDYANTALMQKANASSATCWLYPRTQVPNSSHDISEQCTDRQSNAGFSCGMNDFFTKRFYKLRIKHFSGSQLSFFFTQRILTQYLKKKSKFTSQKWLTHTSTLSLYFFT